VLGRSHATSGAVAWLAGSALLATVGHRLAPSTVVIGAALAAGGALLPDLDMSGKVTSCSGGASAAKTFGVVSLFVAECVEKGSLAVYNLTRTRRDERATNGHRTLTHTLSFNIAAGAAVAGLCEAGRWPFLAVMFVTFATALRGLAGRWARRAGWVVATGAAAAATGLAFAALPAGRPSLLLACAVGVGGVVHLAGDSLTIHGCPLLWPLPVAGRRWYPIGPPKPLRFHTGGRVETAVWVLLLATGAALAGALV
jgi:membrane-bound metal-dependent hydrolase YbcI (DUF457 family)